MPARASRAGRPLAALCCLLLAACAAGTPPLAGGYVPRQLQHREQQVQRGLAGRRDAQAERELGALACRILGAAGGSTSCNGGGDDAAICHPATCVQVRVYVVDSPRAQAQAFANGMLLVHGGLFGQLDDAAELAFALAHEIAHLELGHFARARTAALELQADAWPSARLPQLGYRAGAGATLLRRLAARAVDGARAADPLLAERLRALDAGG